tara:strand:- start:217 stop:486 length:270 start_codon:yes stop_codon:yes gene_type:complete
MKNIKDITLSIFAIIGFVAILSSFNNNNNNKSDDYDRWDYQMVYSSGNNEIYYSAIDKYTGEIYNLDKKSSKWKKRSYPIKLGIYDSAF